MPKKIELGLPDKLKFFQHGSYIEFVRKWFGWEVIVLTFFVMIWNGAILEIFSKEGLGQDEMAKFFAPLFIAVGICITYYTLARWLNRTHVLVSPGKIAVRHKPIPWYGNKEIPVVDIKQLYSKEKVRRSSKGAHITYEVHIITNSDRNIKLLRGLETREQARYLEQEIEKYLRSCQRGNLAN